MTGDQRSRREPTTARNGERAPPDWCFSASTIDDLMRTVALAIVSRGQPITPTKGPARELSGVLLELKNPRARLSRTETRGKAFSCLGELLWYLSEGDDPSFIQHYIADYPTDTYGAYGPRLFNWDGINQVRSVIERLRIKQQSRRAVIQIFSAHDLPSGRSEIPCTCSLQFLVRDKCVCLLVNMRSNDFVLGLPHDVFCFTMLQEIIACSLSVNVGWYRHVVGSLHAYDSATSVIEAYLREGWQTTQGAMPPMPEGDPWPAIGDLRTIEESLRLRGSWSTGLVASLHPYWADLARLLKVHKLAAAGDAAELETIRDEMYHSVYHSFIDGRVS